VGWFWLQFYVFVIEVPILAPSSLFENDPNCMNNSRDPEEKGENEIDNDIHVARLLLQEHCKWWDENGEDNQEQLFIVQGHRQLGVIFECGLQKV